MILIVDKKRKDAESLSEMFYFMGVLSLPATPSEALAESFPLYRAIIIIDPEEFYDVGEFITRLRSSFKSAPVFAISLQDKSCPDAEVFDEIYSKKLCAPEVYSKIKNYTEKNSVPTPGVYKLMGINASTALTKPTYLTLPLPFTKTEAMILRTLIRRYPLPSSSKDILKYAYKSTRLPDLASIRTHISIMNKKFREENGRNLITLSIGEGYSIFASNEQ